MGETFAKHLYQDIGKSLGYGNAINAVQTSNVIEKYLKDERNITTSCWSTMMPSRSQVLLQLKADRPVIYGDRWNNPKPGGGTTDHSVVVYGYNSQNNLVAHFGWTDYTHVECTSNALALFISSACSIP